MTTSKNTIKRHIAAFQTAAAALEKKAEAASGNASIIIRRHARRLNTIASNLKRNKVERAAMLYRRSKVIVQKAVSTSTAEWMMG